jgi:hypothetical protein
VDEKQISLVTGLPRFGYNLNKPYTETIKFFDTYIPTEKIEVPEMYILPQNYRDVIERLDITGVSYSRLKNDTLIEVTVDYIDEFTSPPRPYNGHFYHDKVTTRSEKQKIQYYAGDLVIPVRQEKIKYLLEMFEPKAPDSFFRWNFFDNILDQREYFSSYGFEENALKYLNDHPEFKAKFHESHANRIQHLLETTVLNLAWIYNNSEWLEKTWKRYPFTVRENISIQRLPIRKQFPKVIELVVVIIHRTYYNLISLFCSISGWYFGVTVFAGHIFVGEKIMFEPLNYNFRNFGNISEMSVNRIIPENSNYFVIGLVTVNHPETANWPRIYQQIAVSQCFLG